MHFTHSLAGALLVAMAATVQAQELPRGLGDAIRGVRDAAKKANKGAVTPQPDAQTQKPVAPAQPDNTGSAAPAAAAAAAPAAATATGLRPDPRYAIVANGTEVRDSMTDLTWRRCAEGMRFEAGSCTGQPTSFPSLSRALAHEKTQAGWRLPTIDELTTVVRVWPDHREANTGGVDLLAFPNIPAKAYWSSTYYYRNRGDRDRTKIIYFENGMEGYRDNGEGGLLLLVKTSSPQARVPDEAVAPVAAARRPLTTGVPAASRKLHVSSRGLDVIDSALGLIWARCPEGMSGGASGCSGEAARFDFAAAQARANSVSKASGLPWRLPDSDELRDLSEQMRSDHADAPRVFSGVPTGHFWTSHRTDEQYVYAVDLQRGSRDTRYQTNPHHVLLVRDAK